MNKRFLFIAAMVILAHAGKSQYQFGFKAGINVANQRKTLDIPQAPSTATDTRSFIGYQVGAFYKVKLGNDLLVAAELNFSVIGSSSTLTASAGETYDTNEKLGYIELPLIIQYKINKFYIGAGPSVGFKVFAKLTKFENRSFDLPYYQTLDAAANVMAGCNVAKQLDINARYSHGLVNLYKDPGYAETKNRFFNLSVLYSLR